MIDVRFVPFAQLSLALCGAAAIGLAVSLLAAPELVALALVLLAAVYGDGRSTLPALLDRLELLRASRRRSCGRRGARSTTACAAASPTRRVAVEYDPLHERAGSIRMYETLPFFSGRSTLEGVYNQASTVTHPVYYLASELFARSPNPFRSRSYSRFDPQSALGSAAAVRRGRDRRDERGAQCGARRAPTSTWSRDVPSPYTLYRLRDPGPGYVEPLAFEPVRAPLRGWRDQCYRWFTRKPANRALLVFTDDPRFDLMQVDPWLPPPERPLPGGVHLSDASRSRVDPRPAPTGRGTRCS